MPAILKEVLLILSLIIISPAFLLAALTMFFAPFYGGKERALEAVLDFVVAIFDQVCYAIDRLRAKWKRKRNKTMKTITTYTDGACSGNPGPGGWGAILQYGPHTKEMSGGEKNTTNNRMELTGVIRALQTLKEPCIVELYSDSKYVIDALSKGWAKGWRARGWVKGDKKPALNPDLWAVLLDLCEVHDVRTHWVKGHADNPFNERCDRLAVSEWQKLKD